MSISKEDKRIIRQDLFLEKAKALGKSYIDFSKVFYIDNRTPVIFIDKEYGEFKMTPSNFLKGQDCKQRRNKKISSSKRYSTQWFIKKANKVHNNLYDYSKTVYKGAHQKVTIIDPIYGEFEQEANTHLKGSGHPKRAIEAAIKRQTYSNEEFISLAKEIHYNKNYDYSKVDYKDSRTDVIVTCNEKDSKGNIHGDFKTMPCNFLQGKGCPKCGNHLSLCEDEIANILSQYTEVERGNRTILEGKEIDIFLPKFNIGIEFNGCNFHSEKYNKDEKYHLEKTIKCSEKGIGLIQIFEDEYRLYKDIVIHKLLHLIHQDNNLIKVAGRKCTIQLIDKEIAEQFLEKYHIQGYTKSTLHIGAYFNDTLIAVMSFKIEKTPVPLLPKTKEEENKIPENLKWELTRMASSYDYICQGVAGKLFHYFIKTYKPKQIKSFADRRWTLDKKDNMYIKLGFSLTEIEKPNYTYYNPNVHPYKRFHKFGFRKHILSKKYNLPMEMTESEMTKSLGYYRIWDCGLFKFVWKKEE